MESMFRNKLCDGCDEFLMQCSRGAGNGSGVSRATILGLTSNMRNVTSIIFDQVETRMVARESHQIHPW